MGLRSSQISLTLWVGNKRLNDTEKLELKQIRKNENVI